MDVKLRVLSVGVLFFIGGSLTAQKKKANDTLRSKDVEEVIILGTYGIKETQEQVVGSYSVVTSKSLEKPNALSVDMAIEGQVSGAIISTNSGQPGSNAKVFIRGISSLTGSNDPLYIVDGVPVLTGDNAGIATTSNALAMIDPSDIESVEVLKDGATTSIYGSRGGAGVIIIKTKTGRGGKGKLTLNAEWGVGVDPTFEKFKFMNAQQEVDVLTRGYIATGSTAAQAEAKVNSLFHWDGKTDTDWQKAVRRGAATNSRYNLNYTFGNEKIKGYASVGNTEMEGVIRDALYRRINATVKINAKVNDKINVNISNMVSRAVQYGPLDYGYFSNPMLASRFTSPTQAIYNANGGYNLDMYSSLGTNFNPVAIQEINKRKSIFTKIISSVGLDYNIVDSFRYSSNLGIDYNYYDESEYRNPDFGDGYTPTSELGNGLAIQSDFSYTTLNWSNFFHYDLKLNADNIINLSAGTEATIHWNKYSQMASKGFRSGHYDETEVSWGVNPAGTVGNHTESHLIGYIGRASYGFRNYFNIMGSIRRDGYSFFGENKKYGTFWAAGANVNFQNFGNIKNTFSNLQLRMSYGEVGNTGSIDYLAKPTLGYNTYVLEQAGVINNPGNANLHWEVAKKSNVGVDFGFKNNRLKISFDAYYNLIEDQLTGSIPNAPSTGFGSLPGNALKSYSKGLESSLSYDIFKRENFSWNLNANYSYNRSKVLSVLGPYLETSFGKRFVEGHDPTEWFLSHYYGVDKSNGDALWWTDASHTTLSNGTGTSATIVRDFTGRKAMPTHTVGMTNAFTYGKFSLNFLITYKGDYSVYDLWGRYYDADGQDPLINQVVGVLDAWSPSNPNSDRPQYRPGNTVTKYHSTRYLYKGDHIKLRSAELGYKLTKEVLNVKNLNSVYIYLRGTNLFTYAFDKNLKFDPEAYSNNFGPISGMGLYDQTQPVLRQFMFGAVIDF